MSAQFSLSIILPVYNEEKNIEKLINESIKYLKTEGCIEHYEIIAVNDGSRDSSFLILDKIRKENAFVTIVNHETNLGYGAALVSGVRHSRYPWVLMMDADGQFKIDSISQTLLYAKDYDVVTGWRQKRRDSLYRILLGKIYTAAACVIFRIKIKDINCGFKLIKKDFFNFDAVSCHSGAFYTSLFLQARNKSLRIKEVPVEHYSRLGGKPTGSSWEVIKKTFADVFRLKMYRAYYGKY